MHRNSRPGYFLVKRILDVVLASIGIVVLAPLFMVIAALIWLTMGRPILFVQVRPGLSGTPFRMYKFRTMHEKVGTDGRPLPDEERITPLGRFLRSTSLDELPELFNVLRGDPLSAP